MEMVQFHRTPPDLARIEHTAASRVFAVLWSGAKYNTEDEAAACATIPSVTEILDFSGNLAQVSSDITLAENFR
jgi:hypothetical protein